jgi:hypothetical protein
MQLVMRGLGALIMAGIFGLSGFFIIADERHGHGAEAAPRQPVPVRDISSRRLDDRPLSIGEVFPAPEVQPVSGMSYRIGMTHIDTDCPIATTGAVGSLLKVHGCSQVVRAGMTAPYGGYHVTAGVFNLADADGAAQVDDQVGRLVEAGGGSFAAMAGGLPGTDPTRQPLAQVAWHHRGHFLVYCVISRPDGQVVRDDDPYAGRITTDLVESYLGGTVVGARTLGP